MKRSRMHPGVLRSEDWDEISVSQRNSGIVDVDYHRRSDGDTICCNVNVQHIQRQSICNYSNAPLLDNLDKFRGYLPVCVWSTQENSHSQHEHKSTKTDSSKKKIPAFTAMAAQYENSGPLVRDICFAVAIAVRVGVGVDYHRIRSIRWRHYLHSGDFNRICVGLW